MRRASGPGERTLVLWQVARGHSKLVSGTIQAPLMSRRLLGNHAARLWRAVREHGRHILTTTACRSELRIYFCSPAIDCCGALGINFAIAALSSSGSNPNGPGWLLYAIFPLRSIR